MDLSSIVYRDVAYTVHELKPKQGDLFYHQILKQVDRVTDVTGDGQFLTGTDIGVCRMVNCSLVTRKD